MKRRLIVAGLLAVIAAGCGSGGGGGGGGLIGGTTGGTTGGTSGGTSGGTTSGGSDQPVQRSIPLTTRAQWTVLVYMNGANNLEPYSLLNMDQMETVPYSTNVNIVVEWKRAHGALNSGNAPTTDDAVYDPNAAEFDGTRRFWVTGKGQGNFDQDYILNQGSGSVGSNPTTVDQGDWHHLQNFLQWGETNFPAQHYLVVLWNHGAGWESIGYGLTRARGRGISYDDQSRNFIETWQIPSAFSGLSPVDVVAMDASLMQMMEVNYEMRGIARYIVGSEDSPPGTGYPYNQWLSTLTSQPSTDAPTIARTIADTFANFYQSASSPQSVTQSVVDTSQLPALAQALSTLGNVLLQDEPQYAAQFASARNACHFFASAHAEAGGQYSDDYKDLVEYVTLLKQNAPSAPGLAAAANSVLSAARAAILDSKGTQSNSFAQGLSLFVPSPLNSPGVDGRGYDPTYTNLAFARDTSWARWLQSQTQ